MKNKNKQSKNTQSLGLTVMLFLIGAICGFALVHYLDGVFEEHGFLIALVFKLLLFCVAYYLQLIIHEFGHLLGGLISGYGFGSFRIGSIMLIKENGKIKVKKHSVAGTAGQCLMTPPPIVDGKFPVILYNLGGVLLNLLTIPLFLCTAIVFRGVSIVYAMSVVMILSAFITFITNGIPLKLGMVNNDGSNACELYKSEEARKVFHNQFMTVQELSCGKRLHDMPKEWFFMPSEEGLKNSITVSGAVFRENRLIDEGKRDEALELIDYLLNAETALIGLHRNLLICDKITILLLRGEGEQVVRALYNDQQLEIFMKQMKNNISILRTQYAYALLCEKDENKAQKIKNLFEKTSLTHPYAPDVEAERELILEIEQAK